MERQLTLTIERYFAITDALRDRKKWLEAMTLYRGAALAAMAVDAEPEALANKIGETTDALKKALPWFTSLGSISTILAGLLISAKIRPDAFVTELARIKPRLKGVVMMGSEMREALATLMMMRAGDSRVPDQTIADFRTILGAMKQRDWWVTGPDDIPAAAALATLDEPAAETAQRWQEMYEALRRAGFGQKQEAQAAAALLTLGCVPVAEAVTTFVKTAQAHGARPRAHQYEQAALLSLLDQPPGPLWRAVADLTARLRRRPMRPHARMAEALAGALVYTAHAGGAGNPGVDQVVGSIQAQIAAQQAAMIAATVAATSAATTAATAGGGGSGAC